MRGASFGDGVYGDTGESHGNVPVVAPLLSQIGPFYSSEVMQDLLMVNQAV